MGSLAGVGLKFEKKILRIKIKIQQKTCQTTQKYVTTKIAANYQHYRPTKIKSKNRAIFQKLKF